MNDFSEETRREVMKLAVQLVTTYVTSQNQILDSRAVLVRHRKVRALHPCPTLSRESTVSSWVCWVSEDTLWKKAKDVILKPSASWSFGLCAST